MKRGVGVAIFVAFAISVSNCQAVSPASASAPASTKLTHHGTFTVELTKALNSRKLKPGDEVVAILTGGITLPDEVKVPRGSRVIGHIVEAKSRSRSDSESALEITFDKLIGPGNEPMPMVATIRAIAPNPNMTITTGTMGGAYGNRLDAATTASVVNDINPRPIPLLNDESTGVLGLPNLELGPNGTLTSTNHEVKLDSGTRILLDARLP